MQGLTSSNPSARRLAGVVLGIAAVASGGCAGGEPARTGADAQPSAPLKPAAEWVIAPDPATPTPPFRFSSDDDAFLEEVQRASFGYLWKACDPVTGMVYDRSSVKFASIAGVGFQLAALPIAAERGWVTRAQAQARAESILRALEAEPTNRKAGLFYHFIYADTAKPVNKDVVSTIDSALFFAGAIVAGEYFGGETRQIVERLYNAADWNFFVLQTPRPNEPHFKGKVSLGWKAKDPAKPTGDGELLGYVWADAGDEQRLVAFLGVASPNEAHRLEPSAYYRLRRMLGDYPGVEPHQWYPYSGALFVNFFAHCFINYAALGVDNPGAQGVERRARIDWWENARRATNLHRVKAKNAAGSVPTLGENAWGLTACDGPNAYLVPGVFPNRIKIQDEIPEVDFPQWRRGDDLGNGYVAPYGAGCAIMFEPEASIAALRYYRSLKRADGTPLVWREPGPDWSGGFGFQDSFNLGTGWVAPDCVAIDQGPMVLAIENARTGRVWTWFHQSPLVQAGLGRLGLPERPVVREPR